MADSKKYNGSTWEHSLRKLATATDTFATLPVDVYADGNNATVGISGNTTQNGTPSPDNPIMPQGTGERTGNLFSEPLTNGYTLNGTTGLPSTYDRRCATLNPIDVSDLQNVTITFSATLSRTRVIYSLFDNSTLIRRVTTIFSGASIDVSDGNKLYICFYDIADTETVRGSDISNLMLNSGSTALPYEPYGYKLTISSANTTTPVYLGETESTRRIKKFIFTGTENGWNISQDGRLWIGFGGYKKSGKVIYCTHYVGIENQEDTSSVSNGQICFYSSSINRMTVYDNAYATINAFKTYLQQQYAAGTPVTIWYVLATEETGIVNEPLMKIGDYADTLSGITVPTITGRDKFDVDTTLKPSEASLNYTGWHDATVQEWDGSQWNE